MDNNQLPWDISDKLRLGFDRARLKFLEEKARKNGVVIIFDMEGNVKQVSAKQMLREARSKARREKKIND